MDSLVVPGLDTLRHWLDELGISFFECDSCRALHLPHMQNFDGIFDAKNRPAGQRGAVFGAGGSEALCAAAAVGGSVGD